MSDSTYTMYHCHSDYSLLDSCTKFQDYIDLVKRDGGTAIASTEHGKPLGWIEKKLACEKADIKFIHGVECYISPTLEKEERIGWHTVLLAKNYEGVKELNKLIEMSTDDDHFYYINRISFDEFLGISDNIIKISACVASPLCKMSPDTPGYYTIARHYDYLEVQPHCAEIQKVYNKWLVSLSKEIGKPLICGTDTHSSSPYKEECRKILMLAKGKYYPDEAEFDLVYHTRAELEAMFKAQGVLTEEEYMEALDNTNRMAESIEDFKLDLSVKYPISYGSKEEDAKRFKSLVEKKFAEKVENGIIPSEQISAFRSAIDEEMHVFEKLGMCGFMLSESEIISWCWENGIALGPARGSVAGSRVAFIADIIDVNPETWNTVFSRFCNEDRVEIGS